MLSNLIVRGPIMKVASLPRARHPLHIMPTSCGYERREGPHYDWDGLKRGATPFTIFQYTTGGVGNLRFGDRILRVLPGEAMLLTIPQDHRYWLKQGEAWEFFWLSMSGAEALRIHALIQKSVGPILKPRPATIDRLAGICLRLIDDAGATAASASALAYEAAMILFEEVFGTSGNDANLPPPIGKVIAYVVANPAETPDVGRMADIAGLSRAHFSRIFAAATGLPPAEYLLKEKMRLAAKLLGSNPSLSIQDIAARCGFADPNYFAKVFRRIFGISPSEFRTSGMYFDPASVMPSVRREYPW